MTEHAFPLHWPPHLPRTEPHKRERARFDTTPCRVLKELQEEIARAGGKGCLTTAVISTNIAVRRDGLPLANQRLAEDDPGAAVYFERRGRRLCFACDRFWTVHDNLRAIGKSIEAIRGLERWGAKEMVDQAFTGFAALAPPLADQPWHQVLKVPPDAGETDIRTAYRREARRLHANGAPDSDMAALNVARDRALAAVARRAL